MEIKFYVFITVLSFITAEGRLIIKNKTKTLEVVQTENPNPTIRLTRDIDNESLTGFSKEEIVSDEFLQSYNRRHKSFLETSPKYVRLVRDSKENVQRKHHKIEVPSKTDNERSTILVKKPISKYNDYENYFQTKYKASYPQIDKHRKVLVKKPIPKFSDIDYEDDFQTKMGQAHSVFGDSGDHEDEDFSLDDYDFDVNHDEFLSGRKPLEPRLNSKPIESILAAKPELKIQAKISDPKEHRTFKREGSAVPFSKESSDYYDEATTTTDRNKASQESEIEYSDEGDDSKEGKKAAVRSIRSWDVGTYFNKFGYKTSKVLTKFLSVLPMFPQVPNDTHGSTSS